jgi:hypothetical protein
MLVSLFGYFFCMITTLTAVVSAKLKRRLLLEIVA